MLAYLMLFAALFNGVCLHNAYYIAIDICKYFLFSCFVMGYRLMVYLFQILSRVMRSTFILLIFLISCSHRFM